MQNYNFIGGFSAIVNILTFVILTFNNQLTLLQVIDE